MKTIQVQALTAEIFARYGEFQNLLGDASLASKSVFPYGFFADVVKLDLGGTLVLVALLGLAGPTLFGVSMLNTRIHGAVGEVQDKVRRRRES